MKFLIALVIALAVCGFANAQQMGVYTPIQWDSNNQQLVDILDYGFEQAIPQAIASGEISKGEWNWTNVVSAQEQIVAGINYDFIVDIEDESGNTTRMNLIIFVAPGGSSMSLSNWAIFCMQSV